MEKKTQSKVRQNKPRHASVLRQKMKEHGFTSLRLSAVVGCHRTHLNKILAGSPLPSRRLAIALGKILDMDPAELWMGPKET